jgi:hypothetical protein
MKIQIGKITEDQILEIQLPNGKFITFIISDGVISDNDVKSVTKMFPEYSEEFIWELIIFNSK